MGLSVPSLIGNQKETETRCTGKFTPLAAILERYLKPYLQTGDAITS